MIKNCLYSVLVMMVSIIGFSTNVFASTATKKSGWSLGDIILLIILGVLLILMYVIYRNKKERAKIAKTTEALNKISESDSTWNEQQLKDSVENTYYRLMQALSRQDYSEMQNLVHPDLYQKWESQIEQFKEGNPSNLLNNKLENIQIVDINNYKDDEKDNFTVKLTIMQSEYIVDNKGDLVCDKYTSEQEQTAYGLFVEYWKFEWEEDGWQLFEVSRQNKWNEYVNDEIINEDNPNENNQE